MKVIVAAMFAALSLVTSAAAQTPKEADTLGWMAGHRIHTGADGRQVHEAFLGPVNGVVTGTALAGIGTDRSYMEFHRIAPNSEGVYGLSIANTRSAMIWNFVPLKAIEPGRITFQSTDGSLTIAYFSEPGGAVGSKVDRKLPDGKTRTQEWSFKPTPAPK